MPDELFWRNREALIEYLVGRKFPGYSLKSPPPSSIISNPSSSRPSKPFPPQLVSYVENLQASSLAQLVAFVKEEQLLEADQRRTRADREESQRFFNLPSANADLGYWCKADLWNIDEAVALTFGKNPRTVTYESVEPYANISKFARNYMDRFDLFARAVRTRNLSKDDDPRKILVWVKQKRLEVPSELFAEFDLLNPPTTDWWALYEVERKVSADATTKAEKIGGQLAIARNQIEELSAKLAEASFPEKPRSSDEKMILAMAIKKYRFKPENQKNDAPQNIAHDCEELGLSVNPRTIRDRLYGAAKKLSVGDWD